MTELGKLIAEFEKKSGKNAMYIGDYSDISGKRMDYPRPEFVGHLVNTITHLRSLTRWHTGVPEKDGEYVVEGSDFVGVATFSDEKWASLAFRPWDRVIRWAYLPKGE